MYNWSHESFTENIFTLKNIIFSDYTLTDSECNEMMSLIDNITPEIIESHNLIKLKSKDRCFLINNLQSSTNESYVIATKSNRNKYLFAISSVIIVATIVWYLY